MTRTRIIRLVLLLGLAALVIWIARNTYWTETTVPTPMKGEAATNPFYAAQRFVEHLGATSAWDRFQPSVATDAVIVVSSWHWDLSEGRRARMERWVENGGRLVMDASIVGGEEAFERWSGIVTRYPENDEDDEEDEAEQAEELARMMGQEERSRGCRDLRTQDGSVVAGTSRPGRVELCYYSDGAYLTTTRHVDWSLRDDDGAQVLRVNVGKGSVTVINAVPFRVRQFLRGDHPALLAAAAQLRPGDDVHFLSEEEHASLLTLMWVLGWPVVLLFLAFVALALWRSGVRFGPLAAQPDSARRSLAEQIRGTGQFAMRFGAGKSLHAAAVRALNEAARRRVGSYERLSASDRIDVIARLTGIDAGMLGPAINHTGARRSQDLRSAIALIESARRRILIEKSFR